MKYRQLGTSDLHVSEIALGSWLTFGGARAAERARGCLDLAFGLGVNFVDTANKYGMGAAEAALGEMLAGRPRDSYVLATKVYFPMSATDRGLSRGQVFKQIDASLRRLRTDYVDLYKCHRYDREVPLAETMDALGEVVRQGKVRYIGFSEWSAANIAEALALTGGARFVASQPQYSLLHREPEAKVFPLCAANGISQVVWSPLAEGVLTGKYAPGAPPPAGSRGAADAGAIERWLRPEVLRAVERLKPIAAEAGCTLPQFALAWVLRAPDVAAAIVGASRSAQLDETCAASGLVIDPALFAQAEAIVAPIRRQRRQRRLTGFVRSLLSRPRG